MRDAATDHKRFLVWTEYDLERLGSFEQSLVRLAQALGESGWDFRICCGNAIAPEVAEALEKAGASVKLRGTEPVDAFEMFTRECLLFRPSVVGSPSPSLSNIARSLGAATITTDKRVADTDRREADYAQDGDLLRKIGVTFH